MSEENVEIVRRSWEEFQAGMERGDPAVIFDLGLAAEDFEWILPEPLPDRLVWRGREGFVEFIRTWTAEFDNWSIRLERLIDAGERPGGLAHGPDGDGQRQWRAGRPECRPGCRAEGWPSGSGDELSQSRRRPRSRRAVGVAGLGPARRRLPAAFLGQLLDPCVDLGCRLLQPLHL